MALPSWELVVVRVLLASSRIAYGPRSTRLRLEVDNRSCRLRAAVDTLLHLGRCGVLVLLGARLRSSRVGGQ